MRQNIPHARSNYEGFIYIGLTRGRMLVVGDSGVQVGVGGGVNLLLRRPNSSEPIQPS